MAPSRSLMRGIHPPHVFPKRGGRTSPYDVALTGLLVASALLLALIAFGVISLPVSAPTATTGGEAESTNSRPARPRGRRDLSEGLGERGAQWTEVISWEPRAFVYHNFLDPQRTRLCWGWFINLYSPRHVGMENSGRLVPNFDEP